MENTNKLGIKKYIKLDDGRVVKSEKAWIEIYDSTGKKYFRERCGSHDEYLEIIGESDYLYKFNTDYLYKFNTDNELGLSVIIKQPDGKYEFIVDFNPDNELYISSKWTPCSLWSDQEVLLGSWYEDGMRFVAKWDREKKDWVLI